MRHGEKQREKRCYIFSYMFINDNSYKWLRWCSFKRVLCPHRKND